MFDPLPPFTFCRPQAIVHQEAVVSIPNLSPFSRPTMLPFTCTASPPAPLAIRKAPSASVESIQPRPPRPCEVGRPKGRRRKSRRKSHNFLSTDPAGGDRVGFVQANYRKRMGGVRDESPGIRECYGQEA